MLKKDYIPKRDAELLIWAKKTYAYIDANHARVKAPPIETSVGDIIDEYENRLIITQDPNHGRIDIIQKNDIKKALIKEYRSYIQGFWAKNPYVTNADREQMGLNIPDTTPTTISDPEGQAEAEVAYTGKGQLRLRIKHIEWTPLNSKANYGYRIYYSVYAYGDKPPISAEDLTKSRFSRGKKVVFNFPPVDAGKTAYFAIRYENSKGNSGPWGPMFSAIIP